MFGVGSPRCKKKLTSRAATLRCRPRTTTYYHVSTYYHILRRTTTYQHVLPRTNTYYHVLPSTTTHSTIVPAERSFCISGSHPCMSAVLFLLFYNFTLLLFHSTYSTAAMFGVGGSRCKQVLASRAATFRCRPRTTYYHVIPRTTTYCHPRTIVQAERSFCISGSQPQTSAAKFLHLGQPAANIGRKVFASRTAQSCMSACVFACRPNASP